MDESLRVYVKKVVDAAPPLTPEARDLIRRVFVGKVRVTVLDPTTPAVLPVLPDRPEYRCQPGEIEDPTGRCTWHSRHYWCSPCQGYYGVPHNNGIHDGTMVRVGHPFGSSDPSQCACRPCKLYTGREEPASGQTTWCVYCNEMITFGWPLDDDDHDDPTELRWRDQDGDAGGYSNYMWETFHLHAARRR